MANRASIRANLTVRMVIDSAADAVPLNYTAARTFEVCNANTAFSTPIIAQAFTLSKAGAAIGSMTCSAGPVVDENVLIATVDDANANFVSGDVLRLTATAANLRGRTYVRIIPGVTAAS